MQRDLVTGGAGFLGSLLCDRLVTQGADVLCFNNFVAGEKRNVSHLLGHTNFELMRHDVTLSLYAAVDRIFNLACPASPVHYQNEPAQMTETSVYGAVSVLGMPKRVNARILPGSTSDVYGDPEVHPQTEDCWGRVKPVSIRSGYEEGKRCAETLFFNYFPQHRIGI